MKRIFTLVVIAILIISLCACGTKTLSRIDALKLLDAFTGNLNEMKNNDVFAPTIYVPTIDNFEKKDPLGWYFFTLQSKDTFDSDLQYSLDFHTENENDISTPISEISIMIFLKNTYERNKANSVILSLIESVGLKYDDASALFKELMNMPQTDEGALGLFKSRQLEKYGATWELSEIADGAAQIVSFSITYLQ